MRVFRSEESRAETKEARSRTRLGWSGPQYIKHVTDISLTWAEWVNTKLCASSSIFTWQYISLLLSLVIRQLHTNIKVHHITEPWYRSLLLHMPASPALLLPCSTALRHICLGQMPLPPASVCLLNWLTGPEHVSVLDWGTLWKRIITWQSDDLWSVQLTN